MYIYNIIYLILGKKELKQHVVGGSSLLKIVIDERLVFDKPRGRVRMGIIDDSKEGSYTDITRRIEDREKSVVLDAMDL
jgi:hypothetical protein